MPIDKNGIIYPKEKKNRVDAKTICLIITTCVSLISIFFGLHQNYIQKGQYEKEIEALTLEKLKYENILKENNIQLRSSYILCQADYIEDLFDNLKDEGNIKILSNEITEKFYDKTNNHYYFASEMNSNDKFLKENYGYANPEVFFLKIEVISNRVVRDVNINFVKIIEDANIEMTFRSFDGLENKYNEEYIDIAIGDMLPNEVILIPVVLTYTEIGGSLSDIMTKPESVFKTIYVPKSVTCYDDFYEREENFGIRDVLQNSLITKYFYEELG